MHELALTSDLIQAIEERMVEFPGERVSHVVLEIGRQAAALPDAMRFSFDLCAQGSTAEGARLTILETDGGELRIKEMEVEACAEPAAARRV